jgi:hypothetical protein
MLEQVVEYIVQQVGYHHDHRLIKIIRITIFSFFDIYLRRSKMSSETCIKDHVFNFVEEKNNSHYHFFDRHRRHHQKNYHHHHRPLKWVKLDQVKIKS